MKWILGFLAVLFLTLTWAAGVALTVWELRALHAPHYIWGLMIIHQALLGLTILLNALVKTAEKMEA